MSKLPEQFGKYVLLEKLGVGGMAEIFLARSPSISGISKYIAIKRILPQFSDNEEFVRMFKDEAKIVINLNHNNIVSIFEFGIESEQFFFVMDYVEGKNLRQILNQMKKRDTRFSVEQIVYIIKEVAAGLDHAHRCLDSSTGKPLNITHRDISPQNVMVSFDGHIKVVDFGIAKAESQLENTRAGTLKGKFGYMSPEQAEGHTVDLRTDIFSLGIVFWEMLANDRLFIANNEINTLRKIRDCRVPDLKKYNPNIHPELERIVMKTLERDRNVRYQTAAAMHRDLNRFLNRQYPDFSSHDFSVSVKTLFAEEILETRKKIVKYSKYSFDDLKDATEFGLSSNSFTKSQFHNRSLTEIINEDDEPTESSYTANTPEKNKTSEVKFTDSHSQSEFEAETMIKDTKSDGSQFEDLKNENKNVVLDIDKINKNLASQSQPIKKINYGTNLDHSGTSSKNKSRRTSSRKNTSTRKKTAPNSSLIKNVLNFSIIILIASLLTINIFEIDIRRTPLSFLSHLLPNKLLPEQKPLSSKSMELNNQPKAIPKVAPKVTQPKTFKQPVSKKIISGYLIVQSSPSGAEIHLNSENTGFVTPAKLRVPNSDSFSVTLKRDGFIDYKKTNVTLSSIDNKKIRATLIEASIGYLDIDVLPPTNVKVSINGKLLKGERLPIKGYAVPALSRITIEAFNPYTRKKIRRVVKVGKNKRKYVEIRMTKK